MSDYTDLRDRINTLVSGVTDVGTVHTRPRYGDAFEHWSSSINSVDQIRAWEISLDYDAQTEQVDQEQHWKHVWRPWVIRGWVSLVDDSDTAEHDPTPGETYTVITELATSISDVIDADRRLNGTCHQKDPCQVDNPSPLFLPLGLGDAICWYTVIRFRTLNIVSY